jgi:hypothetical protein
VALGYQPEVAGEGVSRIRSIKPEWLDDERMVLASADARVLSVALLLLADDSGRGVANLALLGGRVYPGNPQAVGPAIEELRPWFIRLYRARGQTFYEIRNWKKHQKIDRPSPAKTPDPAEGEWIDEDSATPRDDSSSTRRILDEGSVEARASRASPPPPDPIPDPGPIPGPDPARASPAESGPVAAPPPVLRRVDAMAASFAAAHPDDVWAFERWAQEFGKTGVTFDDRRALCLVERRRAGMTRQDVDDILAAAKLDPYVNGEKDGKRHDRLSFIFGDQERAEEFRDNGRRMRIGAPPQVVVPRRPGVTRAGDLLPSQLERIRQLEAEEAAEEAREAAL